MAVVTLRWRRAGARDRVGLPPREPNSTGGSPSAHKDHRLGVDPQGPFAVTRGQSATPHAEAVAVGTLQRQLSGRVPYRLKAVEDQVEPELVLVAVVVARLEDVLDRELSEVGVRVHREPGHD